MRFDYLTLCEILKSASVDRRIFTSSIIFQERLMTQIKNRLEQAQFKSRSRFRQEARIHYQIDLAKIDNDDIADSIKTWLTSK